MAGAKHCGPRCGSAQQQRSGGRQQPLARHSTTPRRQQPLAATARSGASKQPTSSEASPAREAAGSRRSMAESKERARRESAQQRVRASRDQASISHAGESAAITHRLQPITPATRPSGELAARTQQETRPRGERLRTDYDRPRPITHRLQPITPAVEPPTTSEQETNNQREQQQGWPRLYLHAESSDYAPITTGVADPTTVVGQADQNEHAQQRATTHRLQPTTHVVDSSTENTLRLRT